MTAVAFDVFTKLLHPDRPSPSAVMEGDGDIGFDWDDGPRAVLSVHVSPFGRVGWAALIGDWSAFGTFHWPEWSDQLDEAFRRLSEAKR